MTNVSVTKNVTQVDATTDPVLVKVSGTAAVDAHDASPDAHNGTYAPIEDEVRIPAIMFSLFTGAVSFTASANTRLRATTLRYDRRTDLSMKSPSWMVQQAVA